VRVAAEPMRQCDAKRVGSATRDPDFVRTDNARTIAQMMAHAAPLDVARCRTIRSNAERDEPIGHLNLVRRLEGALESFNPRARAARDPLFTAPADRARAVSIHAPARCATNKVPLVYVATWQWLYGVLSLRPSSGHASRRYGAVRGARRGFPVHPTSTLAHGGRLGMRLLAGAPARRDCSRVSEGRNKPT
jgi:hypothetical protein